MSSEIPAWQAPLQWPGGAVEESYDARQARQSELLLKAAIVFAMLALTVLDRFGLRISATYAIPPGMMAMYGLVAALFLAGAARLNTRNALACLVLASLAGLSFMVNTSFEPRPYVSFLSLLLLLVLYAPFAVTPGGSLITPALGRWTLGLYVAFALLLALAGIAQFAAQFVLGAEWLFDYRPLIPEAIRASGGWNTVAPAGDWIKSNGFFLREPSLFSIAMALGILGELSLARRKWAIALLGMGLVLSYSGSGLLCLGVAMLFPLGGRTLLRVGACAVVAAAVYFLVGEALNLSQVVERVDEIQSQQSSAYCRFVYPGAMVLQHVDANPWSFLIGNGPGAMQAMQATCADGHQTTYAKLLFEYGVLGAFAFGWLVFGALSRSGAPLRIRVGLGLTWLFLGGNLLASELLLLIYLLSSTWPKETEQ